jgi:hypothetical protein
MANHHTTPQTIKPIVGYRNRLAIILLLELHHSTTQLSNYLDTVA